MAEQQRRRSNSRVDTVVQPAGMVDTEEMTFDTMELLFRLLSSWKLIVGLALVFALVTGVFTAYFITPMYEATSTIYVLSRRDSAINMSDLQIGTALTSDYIKVFQMWEVHEEVISNLGLPYDYEEIQKMLSIANDNGTRMLDITIKSESPEEAASIANEYAKVASQYIADTMATEKPNIMSVALVPANPVSPSITKNVVIALLVGGFLAAAIVAVHMILDDKYKTAEDIRRYTGMSTLAIVPLEDNPDIKDKQNGRRKA